RRPPPPRPEPLRPRADRPPWAGYWPLGCPLVGTAAYDALPWPAQVPVLLAEDLVRAHIIPLEAPPYNLDGWLEIAFGEGSFAVELARLAVYGLVSSRLGRPAAAWEYLLEPGVTTADAASVWCEA